MRLMPPCLCIVNSLYSSSRGRRVRHLPRPARPSDRRNAAVLTRCSPGVRGGAEVIWGEESLRDVPRGAVVGSSNVESEEAAQVGVRLISEWSTQTVRGVR
jgi:hypothetical protein